MRVSLLFLLPLLAISARADKTLLFLADTPVEGYDEKIAAVKAGDVLQLTHSDSPDFQFKVLETLPSTYTLARFKVEQNGEVMILNLPLGEGDFGGDEKTSFVDGMNDAARSKALLEKKGLSSPVAYHLEDVFFLEPETPSENTLADLLSSKEKWNNAIDEKRGLGQFFSDVGQFRMIADLRPDSIQWDGERWRLSTPGLARALDGSVYPVDLDDSRILFGFENPSPNDPEATSRWQEVKTIAQEVITNSRIALVGNNDIHPISNQAIDFIPPMNGGPGRNVDPEGYLDVYRKMSGEGSPLVRVMEIKVRRDQPFCAWVVGHVD